MATYAQAGAEVVPGYRLITLLGRGTFGEVWRASGPGGTESALKIIPLHGETGLKELRTLGWIKNIKHPHLLPITGLWLLDERGRVLDEAALEEAEVLAARREGPLPATLVFATLVGDQSLLDLHKKYAGGGQPGIPLPELLQYAEEAAKGLDFLNEPRHELGSGRVSIQHRDVKPENLLLIGGVTVVGDFGIARSLDKASVTATSMVGSPAYMPPECINGEHLCRTTDQYSFALTYYFLRTGSLPFPPDANYFAVINSHISGDLDLSRLDSPQRRVLERATALDPGQRFATCREMVDALRSASVKPELATPPVNQDRLLKKTELFRSSSQAVDLTSTNETPTVAAPELADQAATASPDEPSSLDAAVETKRDERDTTTAETVSRAWPADEISAAGEERKQQADSAIAAPGSVAMNHAARDYLRLLLEKKLPSPTLQAAWQDFYDLYTDVVRRVLLVRGVAVEEVNGWVGEVWALVAAHLLALETPPQNGLRTWLWGLIQQKTNELLVRRSRAVEQPHEATEEVAFDFPKPTREVWAEAMFQAVLAAVRGKISDTDYRVLHLRLIGGQDAEAVAEALHLPVEQVRYRHFRASRKLQVGIALFTGQPIGTVQKLQERAP